MAPLSYLVCATERSGSTLLCELLAGTGVAGRPEEYFEFLNASGRVRQPREYFADAADPSILELLAPARAAAAGASPWAERLAAARERGTTPNGVFGAKMMWAYLGDFLAHGEPEEQLGPLRWVHVERRDTLAQAISLWRAVQTAQWRAEDRDADGRARLPRRRDRAPQATGSRRTPPPGATGSPSAGSSRSRSSTRSSPPTREPTICAVLDHVGVPSDGRATSPSRRCAARPTPARRSGSTASETRSPHERRADDRPPPLPAARARGRGGPHHARGRRAARAAGAAVQRRQGLDRAAAAGREGVPARRVPVPGHARRHGPQLPRGARVPRPPRARARRAADRRLRAGLDRHRPGGRGDRPGRLAQPAADHHAARRDRRQRLRRGVRRRPPRRGARPREGADLLLPRRARPVGPARPAARGLEPLQRRRRPRRERARVPALELDRARRLALHRRGAARDPEHLLRPRARGVRARRDAARGLGVARAARGRGGPHRLRALPHGRAT